MSSNSEYTRTGQALASAWNNNQFDEIALLLADDLTLHGPRPAAGRERFMGNIFGKMAFLAHLRQLRDALGENAQLNVTHTLAGDNSVSLNYVISGEHVGLYLNVPPTQRKAQISVQDTYVFRDGLIAEVWHNPDRYTLLERLTEPTFEVPDIAHFPVEVVATLKPGAFTESLVAHPNGDIYISYMFDGQIVRVSGSEVSVAAQLPEEAMVGFMAGISTLNIDAGGTIVASVISANPAYHGVWQFHPDTGEASLLGALPPMNNHLNGSAIDDEGRVYVADSTLGLIWQVVPGEGVGKVWSRDPLLGRRPYIGLAPGANGMRFHKGKLYVTVSDQATIVTIPVKDDGSAGVVEVLARDIHGDDFAIDTDGTLYVTTHVENSVVKVCRQR